MKPALGALLATLLLAAPTPADESRVRLAAPEGRGCPRPLEGGEGQGEGVDLLWHHRNLGKALYENPATQYDAVAHFETALALAPDSAPERVNLGLALLRAGRTEEGIAQLERAQRDDPAIPHTWFNLGIAYKRASRYAEAIRQLEGMAERVPDEAITHYNLGVLYRLEGEPEKAVAHFERAAALDPDLAGPRFQLSTAYRQAGRAEEAAREMALFRELKARDAGAAVPEDLEWSWYSEIYEAIAPEPRPAPDAEPAFAAVELARGLDPATAGLALLAAAGAPSGEDPAGDAVGDPGIDLLAWSKRGIRLFPGGAAPVQPAQPAEPADRADGVDPGESAEPSPTGLEGLTGVRHAAAGDLDGDGLHDLVVLTEERAVVLVNRGDRFEPLAQGALPPAAARRFDLAVWLDYDHDNDLDLLLFGPEPALLRNDGDGPEGVTFSDRTADFPFDALAGAGRVTAAARLELVADTPAKDLAVAFADRPGLLLRDRLAGRFEARPLPELPAGTRALLAADADHDGWTDLVAATGDGVVVLRNDRSEGFEAVPVAGAPGAPLALADLANRGAGDLVAGGRPLLDRGRLRFEPLAPPAAFEGIAPGTGALAAADFDGDGRTDLAAVTAEGALVRLDNRTESANRSLRVALAGVRNPKLAPGAQVEVKAGSLYQKRAYDGVPLVFGLGTRESADAVRITWPNGLIQNETRQAAGTAARYEEAQRLSGSCPMVFAWNGEEFEFITDVLGVAPLGVSAGGGEYFSVNPTEVVQIAAESLAETPEGRYEVRITEELREVGYLDRVRLLAVDRPAGLDVFVNDKFKGPPFPEFRLFGVGERRYPVAARDHRGADVLERVLTRDARYPDGFERDYSGLAELHHLELDFGPDPDRQAAPGGRAVLVLHGWVDWADGSTFLAASQGSGPGLILPYLQVRDEAGEWVTVIEDMGLPAGKPKTIVVDLTGKWLSASREVRIVTSACVYWDEIYLGEGFVECRPDEAKDLPPYSSPPERTAAGSSDTTLAAPRPERSAGESRHLAPLSCRPERSAAESRDLGGGEPLRLAEVPVAEAELRFRGFARPVVHPQRLQPEVFVYADWTSTTMWDQTPGLYTRYGDVAELLAQVDDRFVVFGAGDELALSYDARALPALPDGWRRDFLLWVDGWAKDGDANTAYSQTVEPLPYRAMPQYPYDPPHAYPDTPEHNRYREEYLTRPALRLIRPLTEGTPADPRRAQEGAPPDPRRAQAGAPADPRRAQEGAPSGRERDRATTAELAAPTPDER